MISLAHELFMSEYYTLTLSGVRMYSPHAPLKWRLEKPQKSNLNPEIVAVRMAYTAELILL